jgi:hypothetical protein
MMRLFPDFDEMMLAEMCWHAVYVMGYSTEVLERGLTLSELIIIKYDMEGYRWDT